MRWEILEQGKGSFVWVKLGGLSIKNFLEGMRSTTSHLGGQS